MEEFGSSWEAEMLNQNTVRRVVEESLPFIPAVVWSAPVSKGLGIYPAETAEVYADPDGTVHVNETDKKWLVRVMHLREDPGYYNVYPGEEHRITEEYKDAKPGSPEATAREREALEYAKKRIGKFDELLHKMAERSQGAFKLPQYGRFYSEDAKNPLLLTVVEYIEGADLMDPENAGTFSEEAKHTPGLRQKLDATYTAMATVAGELPHNAAFVPTDIIGGWRQFTLAKPNQPGGERDMYMHDLDPYVGVVSEERQNLAFGFRTMAKQMDQLLPSTPLPPELKVAA